MTNDSIRIRSDKDNGRIVDAGAAVDFDRRVNEVLSEKYVTQIEKQKRLAVRNRDRQNWFLLAAVVAGVITAFVRLWFDVSARPGDIVGSSVECAALIGLLLVILFHRHKAKCPQCGYDWEIDEQSEAHMLTWTVCPGCGLKMKGPAIED